jgi:hypothetical protein
MSHGRLTIIALSCALLVGCSGGGKSAPARSTPARGGGAASSPATSGSPGAGSAGTGARTTFAQAIKAYLAKQKAPTSYAGRCEDIAYNARVKGVCAVLFGPVAQGQVYGLGPPASEVFTFLLMKEYPATGWQVLESSDAELGSAPAWVTEGSKAKAARDAAPASGATIEEAVTAWLAGLGRTYAGPCASAPAGQWCSDIEAQTPELASVLVGPKGPQATHRLRLEPSGGKWVVKIANPLSKTGGDF